MEVYGYELLFRAADEGRADVANPNEATAHTIVTTFGDIGLDTLVGGRMCFVNVTRETVAGKGIPSNRLSQVQLAGLDDTSTELTRTAMLRGKMAELVSHELERPDTEAYFTVGLFSVIDA